MIFVGFSAKKMVISMEKTPPKNGDFLSAINSMGNGRIFPRPKGMELSLR